MIFPLTDAAEARSLIEDHIAHEQRPALSEGRMERLLILAATVDPDSGDVAYTLAGLKNAVVSGWTQKAGLTAHRYDIGGGNGKYLKQSDWHKQCRDMARDYATGVLSVTGDGHGGRVSGIGSIAVVSSTAASCGERWP